MKTSAQKRLVRLSGVLLLALLVAALVVPAAQAAQGTGSSTSTVNTLQLPTLEQTATFECTEDQFILNAALRAELGLPFGCRMGSCGQCSGRLLQGKVEHAEQYALSDELIEMGYTLLCKSQPRSDVVIMTHQEMELGL